MSFVGLEVIAMLCAVLQNISVYFALGSSTPNSLGVLLFICTAMAIYTPMFVESTKMQNNHNNNTTSSMSHGKSTGAKARDIVHTQSNSHIIALDEKAIPTTNNTFTNTVENV